MPNGKEFKEDVRTISEKYSVVTSVIMETSDLNTAWKCLIGFSSFPHLHILTSVDKNHSNTSRSQVNYVCVFPQSEPPNLTEEQLHGLLEDCELTESWIQNLEMNDAMRP